MDAHLNLTPKRGPSVWEAPRTPMNWSVAAIAGGSLLAAYAWANRSQHRSLLTGLGVGTLACGLMAGRAADAVSRRSQRVRSMADLDDVDRMSKDSFPASDPPAMK